MKDLEVYIEIQGGLHYVIKKSRGIKLTVIDLDSSGNSEQFEAEDAVVPGEGWKGKTVANVINNNDEPLTIIEGELRSL